MTDSSFAMTFLETLASDLRREEARRRASEARRTPTLHSRFAPAAVGLLSLLLFSGW